MTLQADLDEEDPSSREDSISQQMWSKVTEEDIFHPTFHSLPNQSNK